MAKVKICGLTRPCDIEAVNAVKPDYIGFVFAESRRKVSPRQAALLRERLAQGICPVGVFAGEKMANIVSLLQAGVVDIAQLHGQEDEAYIQALKALTQKPVIKAIAVENTGDVQKWANTAADYLLLDSKGGGTGRVFGWNLIGETSKPYFLAGGLHRGNIAEAIQITKPFAVDLSSGVETAGLKDPEKIIEIVRRIRNGA